jgi:hypothetical protein
VRTYFAVGNIDWIDGGRPRVQISRPGMGKIFSPFSEMSTPILGPTKLPIQWAMGTLSPGVKRPGRETDHSLPTSAEVKKMWIYISIPPYVYMT